MDVQKSKIEKFFSLSDTQFAIPVFQRNYDWGVPHCKQLLDDIVRAGDSGADAHFIGTIVYLEGNTDQESDIEELMIIDGQQRITTLTLMYIAIREIARQDNDVSLANKINETYLINKYASKEKLKLRPTQNNDDALQHLINRIQSDPPFRSNLVVNFKYFTESIHLQNYKAIMAGLSKLTVVKIALEKGKDDPQQIFESINSTGLELSQADLIRNYILMNLDQENQSMVYNKYWKFIEEEARDAKLNQSRVSHYIRHYLTIKNNYIPNQGKVYLEFKNRYPCTTTNFQSLTPEFEKELGEMTRLVALYSKLINPSREADKAICAELEYINCLEVNVAHPFLLKVYDDYASKAIDKPTFLEVLKLIQSYVWRRFVVGLQPNELNKIFRDLHKKIVDPKNYLFSLQRSLLKKRNNQRFPTDKEVSNALLTKDMYNIKNKSRDYFFQKIEHHENRELIPIIGNTEIQAEHIFPQNPAPQWWRDLGKDDYNEIKESYLHTIGNLTQSGNNGELGNKPFAEKKELYKKSRLWLNRGLCDIEQWNLDAIKNRCSVLTERALDIWTYPSGIDIELIGKEEELNIFDAGDPTGKKLEYVTFLGEEKPIRRVADLYKHVFVTLYELDPDRFYHDANLTKLRSDAPQQPLKLSDSFVMSANLSNEDKFKKIKDVLTIFGFKDELIIKYASE